MSSPLSPSPADLRGGEVALDLAGCARVRHAHRLFLGRAPDRLATVTAWAGPTAAVVAHVLASAEFAREIERPLREAGVVSPLRFDGEPGPDLIRWTTGELPLGEATRAALQALAGWRALLRAVLEDVVFGTFLEREGLGDLSELGAHLAGRDEPLWQPRGSGSRILPAGPADVAAPTLRPVPPLPSRFGSPTSEAVDEGGAVQARLVPVHDATALPQAGAYRATGPDPQLLVELDGRAFQHRVRIVVEYRDVQDGGSLLAQLYLDDGDGFREDRSVFFAVEAQRLEVLALLESPRPIVRLRFDPANQACGFTVATFELTPLPGPDSEALSAQRRERLRRGEPDRRPAPEVRPAVDPAVDFARIGRPADEREREARKRELFIDPDATVIVAHGEEHPAERRAAFSLYTAIMLLRRRGRNVVLVRTGREVLPALDLSLDSIRRNNVVSLGELGPSDLLDVCRVADLFVQPGAPGADDRFGFPSHLPAFLASGRPVVLPRAHLGLRLRDGVEARLLQDGRGLEIAQVVAELMADPARAEAIGQAGREAARKLDPSVQAAALDAFYAALLSDPATRPARPPA